MCTYEDLVAATLPYGLSPLVVPAAEDHHARRRGHRARHRVGVVPQRPAARVGAGDGHPHRHRRGRHRIAATQHADLFRAFPNSYGTLGYSVRLKIELEPVKPFVALRHLRFHSLTDLVAAMDRIIETGGHDGDPVDYLDGVVFSADESYLCLGFQTATPGPVSDYTGQHIYYRSIQHARRREARPAHHPRLPVALGHRLVLVLAGVRRAEPAHPPVLAAALPAQQLLLEADRLRPAVRHRRPHREAQRPAAARARGAGHRGADRALTAEFLDWFLDNVPIEPIWLCPLRLARRRRAGRCTRSAPHHTYVNVGFWSSVPVGPEDGHTNKLIERKVSELDGHKSLYSDAFYSPEEFDELYGGETYKTVKKTYDPDSRLLDLYAKAVQRR